MMIATVRKRMPLLTLFSVAMLSPPLYAADGNINVTGRVVENACVVAPDSKNLMMDFGVRLGGSTVSTGEGIPRFIKLLDCPSGVKQVKVKFEGNAIDGSDHIFAPDNQGQQGAAQNVGFGIYDFSDIKVNGESRVFELENNGSGSENNLEFLFMWYRLDKSKPISLGEVTGTIQFTILYN